MRRVLTKGPEEFEVVEWNKLQTGDSPREFSDESSALRFLRGFLRDHFSMMTLRDLLSRGRFCIDLSRLDDQGVIKEVARALVSGRIKIVRSYRLRLASHAEAEERKVEETLAPPAAVVPETRNWIKLRIVDDETGQPVPGVAMKLKLPSGRVEETTTDGDGTIEIKDLPPGTLDIKEMMDSDALEVVQIA